MNNPKPRLTALAMGIMTLSGVLHANTPLLTNTNFAGTDPWITGANLFVGTVWNSYVTLPAEGRITRQGDKVVFASYDDGTSDMIESFLLQEFRAGPATGAWPSIFQTGDVIVFKGTASATRSGTDTSDMIVRAFVKTLGYNELGWEFQIKPEYTDFHPIGAAEESFELSITYPDLALDDSLQVVQIGFEITTSFDGANMDSGTITFGGLEAYVVGDEEPQPVFWLGFEVDASGWAQTGDYLGLVWVNAAPWIWSYDLSKWMYLPEAGAGEAGAWVHLMK